MHEIMRAIEDYLLFRPTTTACVWRVIRIMYISDYLHGERREVIQTNYMPWVHDMHPYKHQDHNALNMRQLVHAEIMRSRSYLQLQEQQDIV